MYNTEIPSRTIYSSGHVHYKLQPHCAVNVTMFAHNVRVVYSIAYVYTSPDLIVWLQWL